MQLTIIKKLQKNVISLIQFSSVAEHLTEDLWVISSYLVFGVLVDQFGIIRYMQWHAQTQMTLKHIHNDSYTMTQIDTQ